MTYTKINLYLANGIPEALSNLWYGSDSAVVEIRDAVEDAKNGKDLLNRIQKMKLLQKFTLDRETKSASASRVRIAGATSATSKLSDKGKTDRRKGVDGSDQFSGEAFCLAHVRHQFLKKFAQSLFVLRHCRILRFCCFLEQNPDLRNQPTKDMWDFKDEQEDRDDSWMEEEEDGWDEEDYDEEDYEDEEDY